VIGKRDHGDAHTTCVGGVNAALGTRDPEDDWTIHAADTFEESQFVNDPEAVQLVAREMPDRIRELAQFMERHSPDRMELDARDLVAREVRESRGSPNGGVYLGVSHRNRSSSGVGSPDVRAVRVAGNRPRRGTGGGRPHRPLHDGWRRRGVPHG
jgi:succinate dehydrogenase/fumarate reductase flavoprotein subunit